MKSDFWVWERKKNLFSEKIKPGQEVGKKGGKREMFMSGVLEALFFILPLFTFREKKFLFFFSSRIFVYSFAYIGFVGVICPICVICVSFVRSRSRCHLFVCVRRRLFVCIGWRAPVGRRSVAGRSPAGRRSPGPLGPFGRFIGGWEIIISRGVSPSDFRGAILTFAPTTAFINVL